MKVFIHTFGCKVNQYESQELLADFCNKGMSLTNAPDEADVCIVNSCAVTSRAEQECRQLIRGIVRKNKNGKIMVTGCYAARALKEIESLSPRIRFFAKQKNNAIPLLPAMNTRQRAFLKVQDGCNARCTYCIIPYVRPALWSKPAEDVINEVGHFLSQGYCEIVLTGIRLGLYKDKADNLVSLLEKIISLKGHFRIRLSSLEVTEVKDQLIDLIRNNRGICRHLHIPLQSGDDHVLKDMDRPYTSGYFLETVNKVRTSLPDCGITSDVIVGFPTESDKAFKNTVNTVKEARLSGLHVFRFSPRPGTKAANLKPLATQTVRARATSLSALTVKQNRDFRHLYKGTKREVLVESSGYGWTDNYIRVKTPESCQDYGKLVHLPIT